MVVKNNEKDSVVYGMKIKIRMVLEIRQEPVNSNFVSFSQKLFENQAMGQPNVYVVFGVNTKYRTVTPLEQLQPSKIASRPPICFD